jgi:hypothetical protein
VDRCRRVDEPGVGDGIGAQRLGKQQLVLGDVDGDDFGAGDLGVLHGVMTESADAEDGDHVRGACSGDLHRLVRRDARTRERSRLERVDAVWYVDDEVRRSAV